MQITSWLNPCTKVIKASASVGNFVSLKVANEVFHVVVLLYKSKGHAIQQGPVSQYVRRATTPNFTFGDRFAHYGISIVGVWACAGFL